MTYQQWLEDFKENRKNVLYKLKDLKDEEVYEYFLYDNMVKNEPNYCGLYALGTKCHQMDDLNCFNCGCPHFQVLEEPLDIYEDQKVYKVQSTCKIGSRHSGMFKSETVDGNEMHCDCSNCTVPHKKKPTLKEIEKVRKSHGIPYIPQGNSLLFHIRSWQLSEIFKGWKLF